MKGGGGGGEGVVVKFSTKPECILVTQIGNDIQPVSVISCAVHNYDVYSFLILSS